MMNQLLLKRNHTIQSLLCGMNAGIDIRIDLHIGSGIGLGPQLLMRTSGRLARGLHAAGNLLGPPRRGLITSSGHGNINSTSRGAEANAEKDYNLSLSLVVVGP